MEWIKKLTEQLPQPTKRRKTFLDIAGVQTKESVNSSILSFFLTEDEDHQLKRLFFDSLLSQLVETYELSSVFREIYDGPYIVEQEVESSEGRIDILITSESGTPINAYPYIIYDWAIIIENKILAPLDNDLKHYYNSIIAKEKFLLLLSNDESHKNLRGKIPGVTLMHILHKNWMNDIKKRISEHFLSADDRHLSHLREFLQNIENMSSKQNVTISEAQINLLNDYKEEINKLLDAKRAAQSYAVECLNRAMGKLGFASKNNYADVKTKYYLAEQEYWSVDLFSSLIHFRFYIDLKNLIPDLSITIIFELHGPYTKFGSKIKERLFNGLFVSQLAIKGGGGSDGGTYNHILVLKDYSLNDKDVNLEEKLFGTIKEAFFQNSLFGPANGPVEECAGYLSELLKGEV